MTNNESIIRVQCKNGLTIFWGAINTNRNSGFFGIEASDKGPRRTILVSNGEIAEKIANLLIEDFGGVVSACEDFVEVELN